MSTVGFQRNLLSGEVSVCIWGTGFIGYSTMANFANNGVTCVGYDIDEERVNTINSGAVPIETLGYWLGFDPAPLVEEELMVATDDLGVLPKDDLAAHFVAVPTERDGEPWYQPLKTVIDDVIELTPTDVDVPRVVVIESTVTPGTTDEVVVPRIRQSDLTLGEDILIGVAPRRDWFTSPNKNLVEVPRVYGGRSDAANAAVRDVLDIICDNLVEASDHTHAEMVKSVENAYRHMGIALANQLSRSYPSKDVREVLELAATKWNIPTYFPSVGIGGYCIPVASQYVLEGADNPDELTILQDAIETDETQPHVVADSLARGGMESVAILGLAYKGDVEVDILSPTKPLANRLREQGVAVGVHDPYYADEYIEEVTGADSITFPEGLDGFEAVVLAAGHRQYAYTENEAILENLSGCELVLDSPYVWGDVDFEGAGVEYHYTGDAGWLSAPVETPPTK